MQSGASWVCKPSRGFLAEFELMNWAQEFLGFLGISFFSRDFKAVGLALNSKNSLKTHFCKSFLSPNFSRRHNNWRCSTAWREEWLGLDYTEGFSDDMETYWFWSKNTVWVCLLVHHYHFLRLSLMKVQIIFHFRPISSVALLFLLPSTLAKGLKQIEDSSHEFALKRVTNFPGGKKPSNRVFLQPNLDGLLVLLERISLSETNQHQC